MAMTAAFLLAFSLVIWLAVLHNSQVKAFTESERRRLRKTDLPRSYKRRGHTHTVGGHTHTVVSGHTHDEEEGRQEESRRRRGYGGLPDARLL